jgi:hypothetical protein
MRLLYLLADALYRFIILIIYLKKVQHVSKLESKQLNPEVRINFGATSRVKNPQYS